MLITPTYHPLTDHPSLLISILTHKSDKNDHGFWRLNKSLIFDVVHVENMKKKINNSNEFKEKVQLKWEFLNYKIWKFATESENSWLQVNLWRKQNFLQPLQKWFRVYIYKYTDEGIKIRSICEWYGHSEKWTKLFINKSVTFNIESENLLIKRKK